MLLHGAYTIGRDCKSLLACMHVFTDLGENVFGSIRKMDRVIICFMEPFADFEEVGCSVW
jgi:hypothetical protein